MKYWHLKLLICSIVFYLFTSLSAQDNDQDFGDITSSPVGDAIHLTRKEKSEHEFNGFVSFVSDYRFRGISLTMRQPAVQGGLGYEHESGLYLGTFGSNVDGTTHLFNNASMEWDFFGGYKGKLFPLCPNLSHWEYNFGFIFYYYPGGRTHERHSVSYNIVEYYIELIYKKFTFKYWQTLTNYSGICSHNPPENFHKEHKMKPNGSSRGSIYLEANYSWDFYEKWHLQAHVGYQFFQNYWYMNYADWRATLTRDFKWLNVFVTYVGTNANKDFFDIPNNSFYERKKSLGAQGVVIGVVKAF